MKVLILGNGVSRLQYAQEIKKWTGEIWCCNYAFVEFGERVTRIAGHRDVLEQAEIWKEIHGLKFKTSDFDAYDMPDVLKGNSGIFLVSQALYDGYDPIILCGFDFSGKDVWAPDMQDRHFEAGMQRKWKSLLCQFPDAKKRITFWGPKPGFDTMYEKFRPIFMYAENGNKRLREENADLKKRLGWSVEAPLPVQPTEANRGQEYFDMIMNLFKS